MVGSPFPEKVMESTGVPAAAASDIFFSRAASTSARQGNLPSDFPSLFHPHSQYMQSKLHNLPVVGRTFTPNEDPSLRLYMGPKTISSKCNITKSLFLICCPMSHIRRHQLTRFLQFPVSFPSREFPTHSPLTRNVLRSRKPM